MLADGKWVSGDVMKLLKIAPLAAVLLISGCATEMAWRRTDGGPVDRSFHWAAARCRERAADFDRAQAAMRRCMERHGYVWTAVAVGYDDDDDDYDD